LRSRKATILVAAFIAVALCVVGLSKWHSHRNPEDILFRKDIASLTVTVDFLPDELRKAAGLGPGRVAVTVASSKYDRVLTLLREGTRIDHRKSGMAAWGVMGEMKIEYHDNDKVQFSIHFGQEGQPIFKLDEVESKKQAYQHLTDVLGGPEFVGRSNLEFLQLVYGH
jgi:hypothetical protein